MKYGKEILGEGKFLRLVKDGGWEYTERKIGSGVVVIIAVHEGRLILVEQPRAAVGCPVLELPAGLVGDTAGSEAESFELAARRELLEETGYAAERFERLTEGPPTAGLSSEIVTFYYAHNVRKEGAGGGDGTENITVHLVPLGEIESWCASWAKRRNGYVDAKTFAGGYFARVRTGDGK